MRIIIEATNFTLLEQFSVFLLLQFDPEFELGYFEVPVISNSKPFSLDLPFSHLLSAISNSRCFEQFVRFPWKFEIAGLNCMIPTMKLNCGQAQLISRM